MSPELTTRHFDALGSTCELLSVDSSQAALERCEQRIRDAEARFTRFLRDSELAGLNASDGRYVPVSPEMFAMLQAALWAFEESDGLVNAAVLPALAAAGYDRPFRQGLTEPAVLRSTELPPLPEVLRLDQATRSAALAPGAALDLGGFDEHQPGAAGGKAAGIHQVPGGGEAADPRILVHRRHHHPVPQQGVAQRQRREQDRSGHDAPPGPSLHRRGAMVQWRDKVPEEERP